MSTLNFSLIRWTYVLGISLLLAAAAFYVETWWHGTGRIGQTMIITAFVILFFGMTFLCRRSYPFFSRISFLAGLISLGPAIALIGTIYHSQGEAYWLFLLWLLPVMLVTVQLKSTPFLLLRFLLIQALVWAVLFPTYHSWPQSLLLTGLGSASILNFIIYIWSERQNAEKLLQIGWFTMFQIFAVAGAVRYVLPEVEIAANAVYILLFTAGFVLFRRRSAELRILIASAAFYLAQLILLSMIDIISSMIFLVIFLLAGAAVYGSIRLIKSLKQGEGAHKWKSFSLHTVTVVGAMVAASSFAGFMGVFAFDILTLLLFMSSIAAFVVVYVRKKEDPYVNQAIMLFGVFLILGVSYDLSIWQIIPVLLLFGTVWQQITRFSKVIVYIAGNVIVLTWLGMLLNSMHLSILILLGINIASAAAGKWILKERELFLLGYLGTLISAFALPYAVIDIQGLYWIYILGYFTLVTVCIYVQVQLKDKAALIMTAAAWFIFVFVQYADLLWNFIHVSITLAVLGVSFLIAAHLLERKKGFLLKGTELTWGWSAPGAMLVTLAVIIIPAVQSEAALREGDLYWVEVEHYNAEFMELESTAYFEINSEFDDQSRYDDGSFVYGELHQQESGNYRVEEIKLSADEAAEPFIRGRVTSWGYVDFGIDSYPHAEGEIEKILLRVGTDGVAVIDEVHYTQ